MVQTSTFRFEDARVDFGHNRTLSLERARGKGDDHLLIDADMVLNVSGPLPAAFTEDADLIGHDGPLDYQIVRLVSDRHEWRYVGVTHGDGDALFQGHSVHRGERL